MLTREVRLPMEDHTSMVVTPMGFWQTSMIRMFLLVKDIFFTFQLMRIFDNEFVKQGEHTEKECCSQAYLLNDPCFNLATVFNKIMGTIFRGRWVGGIMSNQKMQF